MFLHKLRFSETVCISAHVILLVRSHVEKLDLIINVEIEVCFSSALWRHFCITNAMSESVPFVLWVSVLMYTKEL